MGWSHLVLWWFFNSIHVLVEWQQLCCTKQWNWRLCSYRSLIWSPLAGCHWEQSFPPKSALKSLTKINFCAWRASEQREERQCQMKTRWTNRICLARMCTLSKCYFWNLKATALCIALFVLTLSWCMRLLLNPVTETGAEIRKTLPFLPKNGGM